ncbi:hypothetical protein H5410_010830 [Solanum commersonii]|uniref:Uncharacterized protein n=1 Tax=Solanum commersonii TaxID=4109 RepID=A0A9J6AMM8_SOLCO|nr:hypothetical protein H5410_010830 [Solanum commersonii]
MFANAMVVIVVAADMMNYISYNLELLKEVPIILLREKIIQMAGGKTRLLDLIFLMIKVKISYTSIILGTPFINAIYPFTNINAKGFLLL